MQLLHPQLEAAKLAHQQGQLQQALIGYRSVLAQHPNHPELLHLLGVASHQQGELKEALEYFQKALALLPQDLELSFKLGNLYFDLQQYESALKAYNTVFQVHPTHLGLLNQMALTCLMTQQYPEAESFYEKAIEHGGEAFREYVNLGVVYKKQNKWHQALCCYEKALQHAPHNPDIYLNLGNVYKELDQLQHAEKAYQKALNLNPSDGEAHYNYSLLLSQLERPEEALTACQKALSLNPHFAEGYATLGSFYFQLGKIQTAIQCYEQALRLKPDYPKAHYNMATIINSQEPIEKTVQSNIQFHLEEALELWPHYPEAHEALGNLFYKQGYYEKALHHLQLASQLLPHDILKRIRANTLCRIIPQSNEEIAQYREKTRQWLQDEIAALPLKNYKPLQLSELGTSQSEPPFYLPYHGQNDVEIKTLFGNLYQYLIQESAPPELLEKPTVRKKGPYHIGFSVTEHHENIFYKLFLGFVNALDLDTFHITLVATEKSRDYIAPHLPTERQEKIHWHILPKNHSSKGFSETVKILKAHQFDVFFFDEVGTSSFNYFLPYFRIAPIQCTSHGLPITTGNPEMDYFLTGDTIEEPSAQDQYREELYFMETPPMCFLPPSLPSPLKSRQDYSLPGEGTFYFCPQRLFKLHPDFDTYLSQILDLSQTSDNHPEAFLVFLEAAEPVWTESFKNRLTLTLHEKMDRVIFLPRQSYPDYLNLYVISDVVLDPLHYTGGTTSLEGLALGVPIVTQSTSSFRGAFTEGCFKVIDVLDTVAHSQEEYVQIAVELGKSPEKRHAFRQKLLAQNAPLLKNALAPKALEKFFLEAIQKRQP
jgi:protein O-GlcNAc transferase